MSAPTVMCFSRTASSPSISAAASRSAVSVAFVVCTLTTSPWRLSVVTCPRKLAMSTVALKRSIAMSLSIMRSRFLLNTEWFHTESSIDRPTNQRNSKL